MTPFLFSIIPIASNAEASLSWTFEEIRVGRAQGRITGPVIVELAAGLYRFGKGVRLTAADSGRPDAPLILRAAPGASIVWTGSYPLEGWTPVSDPETRARLAPEARSQVLTVHLPSLGITDLGAFASRGFTRPRVSTWPELFYRGARMPMAAFPAVGFATIRDVPKKTRDPHGQMWGDLEQGFYYEGDRPGQWKDLSDILVFGYWASDWASTYERIERLDPATRHLCLAPPHGVYGYRPGQRIRFYNILEELTAPGQWVLERSAGRLYFWPPAPPRAEDVTLSVLEEPFLTLEETSHVHLEGITFREARGTGLRIKGGEAVVVDRCRFEALGNDAIDITGGVQHTVRGGTVGHTGDAGIRVTGGDRKTLTPAGHVVEHNHIHHVARITTTYVPAVEAFGVGIRIAHNLIHDHPHAAIILGGNQILIEFNEIHHVCLDTGDVGALYLGRDYTFRENVIRSNFIHHTGGVGMGSMGIYNDDCVSGTHMIGNLFWKVHWAVFLGGGRDFVVAGNLFLECAPAIHLDGRGLDPSPVWSQMVRVTMKERLEAMNWRSPPYSTRYPELSDLLPYYEKRSGIPPGHIQIAHNICAGGQWAEITWHATPDMVTFENNLITPSAEWIEVSGKILRLHNPPPLPREFKPIPLEEIGPQYP